QAKSVSPDDVSDLPTAILPLEKPAKGTRFWVQAGHPDAVKWVLGGFAENQHRIYISARKTRKSNAQLS
ncbi:MAG: hypothetical protein WCB27_09040, partial [Thermoguttaceae bacterium]